MASIMDAARAAAAGGGGMGMDMPSPDMEGSDPNAPEEGPEQPGEGGAADMQQALSMLEMSVQALPGDLAEKAMKHVEALKAIAVEGEAALEGESPEQEAGEMAAGEGPESNAGAVENSGGQGGGSVGGSPVSP